MKTTIFRMSSQEQAAQARARVGALAETKGGQAYESNGASPHAEYLLTIHHAEEDAALVRSGVLIVDPQAEEIPSGRITPRSA